MCVCSQIFKYDYVFSISGTNTRPMSTSQTSSMSGVQPHFLSRGHTYRAVVGDTLVLPCQVENLGKLLNFAFILF